MVIKSDSNGKRHYIVPVCNMMYRLVTAVPPPPPPSPLQVCSYKFLYKIGNY